MQKDLSKKLLLVITLILISLINTTVLAQKSPVKLETSTDKPLNLDFEEGEIGKVPSNWFVPTKQFGYDAKLVEDTAKTGKHSVMIYSEDNVNPNGFGNLMQSIDAKPFRGKRVKFQGAVKTGFGNQAKTQLWLRVDRSQGKVGFFDNMENRPISSIDWKYCEIIADIDEDAETINFGMLLIGKGKSWLDNVSLEELGTITVLKEPAKPLTEQSLTNLTAFAKLYGYVRYFHPSDEVNSTNWDDFLIKAIKPVEEAKNNTELAEKLNTLFHPIAPTVKVFISGQQATLPSELTLQNTQITYWKHNGIEQNPQNIYKSQRVRENLSDKTPNPNKPFIGEIGGGLSCMVPTALFFDAQGTLPHTEKLKVEPVGFVKYSGNDRSTRIVDTIICWNIMQHFYPYFDVVKDNWANTLTKTLTAAANDKDSLAFTHTLRRMMAELQDGHGGVYNPDSNDFYSLPIIWDFVEGKLVVTYVEPSNTTLQVGDIVLKVNNKPSLEALAEKEIEISGATAQWKRYTALKDLRSGEKDSEATLEIQTISGEKKTVTLKKTAFLYQLTETKPEKIAEVKPGVFYVDLDRINDEDFNASLPKLEKAKGIIFDLRGYPRNVSPIVLNHLIDKPVQSARWNVPIVSTPDHKNMINFNTDGRWTLDPKAPRLTANAKVVFITDGRAISYAESYMGIIEAYKLAEIVGAPTAGTNGNINPIKLLGDYTVYWTGMKVLKHDGSQHHGIGIQPTIPVSRTIRGITEKKDEFLEKAIEVVSKN